MSHSRVHGLYLAASWLTTQDTTVEQAAARELLEETNVGNVYLEQLFHVSVTKEETHEVAL